MRDVASTQSRLLERLLWRNRDSEVGRRFKFNTVRDADDYRNRVPLATYDEFFGYINRIAKGETGVLTSERVKLLEPTSGSSGQSKLIPYTASLKSEFNRAIAPWIVDTFAQHPSLLWGHAYWSVSPVVRQNETSQGGLPIGFEDDSEYLGRLGRTLMGAGLAVPMSVKLLTDMETFRYVTLLFLLRCRSLALISVWHPTFLTLLLDPMVDWMEQLCKDIATGRIASSMPIPQDLRMQLEFSMQPDLKRVSDIDQACSLDTSESSMIHRLWPQLSLISCWLDGHARQFRPELEARFLDTPLQAKGLVSTEGFVSVPLRHEPSPALAVRSHFFEFLPQSERANSTTHLAHELERGQRYMVVMTTGGGLYRYITDDIVEVVGHSGTCPLLTFIGKKSNVSDRFGEKLNEQFVDTALKSALERYEILPTFAMIAFEGLADIPAYALFLESCSTLDSLILSVGTQLEAAMLENYHYRYCRELGQLGALRVFRVDSKARETFVKVCQQRGQRLGDIKLSALHGMSNWSRCFDGDFL